MQQMNKYIQAEETTETGASETLRRTSQRRMPKVDGDVRVYLHRNAVKTWHRIRKLKAGLQTNSERLVFDYILENTIGRGKGSDQISNSQFMQGKRNKATGEVIDVGCGLRSLTTIRKARKALVEQGIVFEEPVTDLSGASSANRYGLVFMRDELALAGMKNKVKRLKQDTRRGYQSVTPTNKSLNEISIQRCPTTPRKQKSRGTNYMDPSHVDYLVDQIEQATGDQHSRGAFAQLALTVPEGKLIELLSVLKDRGNIHNKGAWFLATARQYASRRIVRADQLEPDPPPGDPKSSNRSNGVIACHLVCSL